MDINYKRTCRCIEEGDEYNFIIEESPFGNYISVMNESEDVFLPLNLFISHSNSI